MGGFFSEMIRSQKRTLTSTSSTPNHSAQPSRPNAMVLVRRFLSVLSKQERIAWWSALTLAGLSLGILLIVGVNTHIVTVAADSGEYSEAIVGHPRYLNPVVASTSEVDRDLTRLIFSGLLKPGATQESTLEPDLAQSFEVSSDQLLYTVTLKPNLKWQDGEDLTMEDILFTINSIQNADWKSPLAGAFRGVTIASPDPHTITFQLPQPFSPFLQALNVGILPYHLWKNVLAPNARLAELNVKPIGAGPYRFSSIKKDKDGVIHSYTVERNPYYQGIKPHLNRITLQFFDTTENAYNALRSNAVEGMDRVPKALQQKNALSALSKTLPLRLQQYTALFFNQTANEQLRDPVVREALERSTDKAEVLGIALSGDGEVIVGPILPGMIGYDAGDASLGFDRTKAAELLDAAGWKHITTEDFKKLAQPLVLSVAKKKGVIRPALTPAPEPKESAEKVIPLPYHRRKNTKNLSLVITTVDQKELRLVAQAIANGWRTVGVDATVAVVDTEKFQTTALNPRSYEVLLYGQQLGTNQDPYPFWHSSQTKTPGLNFALLANKKVDELLVEARSTPDVSARASLYQSFQKEIREQLPAIFLYRPIYSYVLPSTLQGMEEGTISRASDRWNSVTQWYKKTKWSWK